MHLARYGKLDCVVARADHHENGPVVVLLHGFGAPGDDLVSLAGAFAAPRGTRFVFPAAPLDLGYGRAWWMIDMERLQRDMDSGRPRELQEQPPEGLEPARTHLLALLDEVGRELGGPIVLGGFSQGAMLSCDAALRSDVALAGLVLMSGTFLTPSQWKPLMPARARVPIVMSHGRQDPLLPFAHATLWRDAWREAGADVEWHEFAGGHGIPMPVIEAVSGFLARVTG
jgi:phospholipase/carboxylesterase